jgi:NTP pyrophosphatase (non-canonical NTP hydrolase)
MTTKELNALKYRAYNTAVEHGFHEKEMTDAYYLGLVMSEMGEAINADRKGLRANVVRFVEDMELGNPFKESFEAHIKDSLEDELADVVIRLLDFAGLRGYELSTDEELDSFILSALEEFKTSGLPGLLVVLIYALFYNYRFNKLEKCVCRIILIISGCFKKITGRDYDLWWFVEQKMQYNELRPKLNGKKY